MATTSGRSAAPAKKATKKAAGSPAKSTRSPAKATAAGRSEPVGEAAEPVVKPTAAIELPFLSASVTLPKPGANVRVGPVSMTLPTGYLYYGGLATLAVVGTLEWPIAIALGTGGLVVERVRSRGKAG
ncbi:hypothetical protein G4X40_09590 [Rhodococcus sp. D2-41]|uniref:Uncharacterized protein n=1 Tax=Speluncibacter jeojiensis TaxID=2710754 RepID=A0A9X4RD01_9ACTN|nr:hypothetical protein [Rhodococcus sp. D2-41]MDG3010400.1 hypothetical protein [Rhodococcus sp. D2-41]MDG3014138.1 hypothetical protein [Corynebacteriales bacterium D3-21]